MKTTAKAVDKAIRRAEPKNFDELIKVLAPFRFKNGLTWVNVYYGGHYQGIRLHLF